MECQVAERNQRSESIKMQRSLTLHIRVPKSTVSCLVVKFESMYHKRMA
jgi:hypothetical protein